MSDSIFTALGNILQNPPSGSTDSQRLCLVVIRTASRHDYELLHPHIKSLLASVFSCARDSNVLPVKVAAEGAFMSMFKMGSRGNELLDVSFLRFPFLTVANVVRSRSTIPEKCAGIREENCWKDSCIGKLR